MDLNYPNADGIDSTCHRKTPEEVEDAPEGTSPRCGDEAVTWFKRERGTRFYVCEAHAREILRFGEADRDVLDMEYNELRTYASEQGINLPSPTREDLIRRLLVAPDAAKLPDHPLVTPCRSCHKLTLVEHIHPVEKRCRGCKEGVPELDVEGGVLSSES